MSRDLLLGPGLRRPLQRLRRQDRRFGFPSITAWFASALLSDCNVETLESRPCWSKGRIDWSDLQQRIARQTGTDQPSTRRPRRGDPLTRIRSGGDDEADAPLSADDPLALILADMLAEVLAKEAGTPLGVPGRQDVGSAARKLPAKGGET